jgi:isoamylase
MITAGDEMRRTQGGNNNAYCQDSEISWVDWTLAEKHSDVVRFFQELIALRRNHSLLRRARFFTGEKNARGLPDISWHDTQLNPPAWNDPEALLLAVTFGGPDDDLDLHMMMNMGPYIAAFQLPVAPGYVWKRVVDTALPSPEDIVAPGKGVTIEGDQYSVNGHSIVLLASAPV